MNPVKMGGATFSSASLRSHRVSWRRVTCSGSHFEERSILGRSQSSQRRCVSWMSRVVDWWGGEVVRWWGGGERMDSTVT